MAERRSNFLLVLASVAGMLLLAEAALRVGGFRFSSSFYQRDLELGWTLRPGADGWQDEEGDVHVVINSHGMRDRERTLAKAVGSFRIAVLGDSFTEAKQVELDQTFTSVAEAKLRQCGRPAELLNFGVSHYGTAQEWMLLESRVWQWQPDAVVLAFFTGNDVYNNHPLLNLIHADVTPYYRLVNGHLERTGAATSFSALREWAGRAANHSRVVQLLAETWMAAGGMASANSAAYAKFGKDYPDRLIYHPPDSPEMLEAWEVTEALIAAMNESARAHNARFLLMTLTNAPQVHPDAEKREAFRRSIGSPSTLDYPDRRLETFAKSRGIPALILLDVLSKAVEPPHGFRKGRAATPGFGHWNELGHRMAGEALAARLCAELPR